MVIFRSVKPIRVHAASLFAIALVISGGISACSVADKFSAAASGGGGGGVSSPRELAFVDTPTYDLGSVPSSSTHLIRLPISTTGMGDATIVSSTNSLAQFTFNGGSFPGTGGTCSQPVQGNCSIALLFTAPAGVGIYTNTVSIGYESGSASKAISLTITATVTVGATLTVNASVAYAFGNKNVGSSTDATLTVANTGGLTATAMSGSGLSAPLTFKGGTYPGTGGTCGTSLTSGSTCTLVVNYAPVAAGATNQTLAMSYNNGATTQTTNLGVSGTAIGLASVVVTAPATDPYDFGEVVVGAPGEDVTITLSNTGGQAATSLLTSGLAPPYSYKGGFYPGTGGDCGVTLNAAATCDIVVTYLPTMPGTFTDSLDISYSDGTATQTLDQGLTGTSGNAAILTISDGASYDYGSRTVGTTTEHTFTVTNSGGSQATAIAEGVAIAAPFDFKGGSFPGGAGASCTNTLAAGATCTIIVTFVPAGTGGFSSTIDLTYFNGVNTVAATRSVTGTGGSVANLTISDGATYNFGSVAVSYPGEKTFTVSNVGDAAATAVAPVALVAPFAFKGGTYPGAGGNCGNTLGAGGTCLIVVTYTPSAVGGSAGTLTLNYNDSTAAVSSARALSGTGATITKIVGGTEHTCALYSTGVVKCWGSDLRGQLGDSAANTNSLTPVLVSGITTATDIAAGSEHTCARLANSRIYCWGSDSSGQLGDDATIANSALPVQVATTTDFTKVDAGGNLTCGVRSGGTIQCWGDDSEGGNGDNAGFANNATPVTVSGLTNMTHVSVGRAHACGRRSDGTLRCWGSDSSGQLGNGGANTNSGVPVTPSGGVNNATSTASGGDNSAALVADGDTLSWGADDNGQLGNSAAFNAQDVPVDANGFDDATQLVIGAKHACALIPGATVACAGDDAFGQLGDDAGLTDEGVPVAVSGLANVTVIGVGEYHSCAVRTTGAVYCWGANAAGQLGNNAPPANQSLPVSVLGL